MKKMTKIAFAAAAFACSMAAVAGPNDAVGPAPMDLAGPIPYNSGRVICTAAVNSDGTVAGGFAVNQTATGTIKLGTGIYQVVFTVPCTNITAARGWARIVQVDTLTAGSIGNVQCTTADRAGNANGVFVNCTNSTGPVDTSFFLFVLR